MTLTIQYELMPVHNCIDVLLGQVINCIVQYSTSLLLWIKYVCPLLNSYVEIIPNTIEDGVLGRCLGHEGEVLIIKLVL